MNNKVHIIARALILCTAVLAVSGCEKELPPLEYSGKRLIWTNANSGRCSTFEPQQFPILCSQSNGIADSTPAEPVVPGGTQYPAIAGSRNFEAIEFPALNSGSSIFEEIKPSEKEIFHGKNVEFSGEVLGLEWGRESGARMVLVPRAVLVNDSKVVDLDNFSVDASQKKGGEASLLISPLFDDLVGDDAKASEPSLDIYAHRDTPVRLLAEAIYTSRQAKLSSFRLMGAVERKTMELHCDDPHEVEGRPGFWWRCHQEASDDRKATSLEFVDLGAVGPIHLAEMQGGVTRDWLENYKTTVAVSDGGFDVLTNGVHVEPIKGCDAVTLCDENGEANLDGLLELLRDSEELSTSSVLVLPADYSVSYERVLKTLETLTQASDVRRVEWASVAMKNIPARPKIEGLGN